MSNSHSDLLARLENQHAQDGYVPGSVRDEMHTIRQFEMYHGWKECKRLGIEYTPAPVSHSNVYIRYSMRLGGKLSTRYQLDKGLRPLTEKAKKYEYPVGMTKEEKRKLRAAARKAARVG